MLITPAFGLQEAHNQHSLPLLPARAAAACSELLAAGCLSALLAIHGQHYRQCCITHGDCFRSLGGAGILPFSCLLLCPFICSLKHCAGRLVTPACSLAPCACCCCVTILVHCPAGSGSGQESHHDGARGGRGGGPRGRRRTKFRLMAHDAGFFVAPPAEGDHQGELTPE